MKVCNVNLNRKDMEALDWNLRAVFSTLRTNMRVISQLVYHKFNKWQGDYNASLGDIVEMYERCGELVKLLNCDIYSCANYHNKYPHDHVKVTLIAWMDKKYLSIKDFDLIFKPLIKDIENFKRFLPCTDKLDDPNKKMIETIFDDIAYQASQAERILKQIEKSIEGYDTTKNKKDECECECEAVCEASN